MTDSKRAFERAMRLAVVSGLRSTLGVALLEAAYDRPGRKQWAMAAVGEMVVDKIPGIPDRSSLPAMLPRAAAGAWVAHQVMDREGLDDPWAVPMGAAVSAGVAVLAPRLRKLLSVVLSVPSPLLGLAEDYLAIRIAGDALGLSIDEIRQLGQDSVEEMKGYVTQAASSAQDALQSAGAGST
jgi:hypothetical protein